VCLTLGVLLCAPGLGWAAPEADGEAQAEASAATTAPVDRLTRGQEPVDRSTRGQEPVDRLTRAFEPRFRDEPLAERVDRVRSAASSMGMWSAEPAARGLLLADRLGNDAERARAAVQLAPGLPAAWGALAVAEPGLGSGPALLRGLTEMERNLDASVWWRATAWHVLGWGLVVGGVFFLLASALRLAPAAAHDLSHRFPGGFPPHAAAAVLASLGVVPAVLGEGLVGIAVGAFAVAMPWAGSRHRAALLAALATVMAGVHPVTAETGRWIAALRADPATLAIRNAEVGGLSPAQRERLARLAPSDPAAGHALALWNKRSDRLDEAEHWLDLAGARESTHPVLLNDAANVRLAQGDAVGAIDLYESAVRYQDDAAVLFNLAQVHGSRIELARQQLALEAAHRESATTVRELSELRGNGRLAIDLPWPVADLRRRLVGAANGQAVARALRQPFGGGRLVNEPWLALALLPGLALLAAGVGRGREDSRVCGACRARRCTRCLARRTTGCPVCGGPHNALPLLDALVGLGRPLAIRLVPGLAGVTAGKPFLAWASAMALATAGAAFALRGGVVPDPLVAGYVGQAAFVLAAVALATIGAGVTAWSLRSLR